ncbi:hypothetical protein Tco_0475291 [Tanacetum coccineum]
MLLSATVDLGLGLIESDGWVRICERVINPKVNLDGSECYKRTSLKDLVKTSKQRLNKDSGVDEAKEDESTKKTGKRRKQIARKGLHSDKVDEDESEDSKDDDPILGTNTPINPVPMAIKPPSIATYKIIKQGEKGVYQIVREDGTDIVYINFGAMLKDITRDDLTELYRIVMNRYGVNGPEDELKKIKISDSRLKAQHQFPAIDEVLCFFKHNLGHRFFLGYGGLPAWHRNRLVGGGNERNWVNDGLGKRVRPVSCDGGVFEEMAGKGVREERGLG